MFYEYDIINFVISGCLESAYIVDQNVCQRFSLSTLVEDLMKFKIIAKLGKLPQFMPFSLSVLSLFYTKCPHFCNGLLSSGSSSFFRSVSLYQDIIREDSREGLPSPSPSMVTLVVCMYVFISLHKRCSRIFNCLQTHTYTNALVLVACYTCIAVQFQPALLEP